MAHTRTPYDVTIRVTDEDEMDGTLPGDSLLDRYDKNNNDQIDENELIEAITHYISGRY